VTIALSQLAKEAPSAPGRPDIVGFPQVLLTPAYGDPDLLFVPLLEMAREAVTFRDRLTTHGEDRAHAITMSGIRRATTLMGDSSFSLAARSLNEENHRIVDLDGDTFSLSTRFYAEASLSTSIFQVQIAGKIQAGPDAVRGDSDQSIVLQLDEQQLRQSKLFATSLGVEFLQLKMDAERRSNLDRGMDRMRENAEVTLTMPLGERGFGVAVRRKSAGNEWEVLDAQSNGPLGALTPEIEGNLQQPLAAPAEMLQKRAAARVAQQFTH
jgi:hypothetical protein